MPILDEYGELDIPDNWYDVDSLGNYSFVFPFEATFDRRRSNAWVRRNWLLSVWASIAYICVILVGERLMRRYKKTPFELRSALVSWNAFLATFSIIGFVRTSPEFIRVLVGHGFVHSATQTTYSQDVVFSFWLWAFVVSKFVELFDTAFIVLRKRPLTFLHCYHHVTVLIYCWHGAKELTAAGRWFCWMNYGVHSLMYSYYAVRAYGGIRIPRPVSVTVTSLQILQMFAGCSVVYTVYSTKKAAFERGLDCDLVCHQSWGNLYFSFALYLSYFSLFLRFFYGAYIARPTAAAPQASTITTKGVVLETEKSTTTRNGELLATEKGAKGHLNHQLDESYIHLHRDELRRRRRRRIDSDSEPRKLLAELILKRYYQEQHHCEKVLTYSNVKS